MTQPKMNWNTSQMLSLNRLHSGGLITNYVCSSACAHCLYRSNPRRDRAYITRETARDCFATARRLGCRAMHIGGGEPFLNPRGLVEVLRIARETGMTIDYVETNCSWYRGHEEAVSLLLETRSAGCDTLLLSIDPFHNAFIPLAKTKGVMRACRATGVQVFPWLMEFFEDLDRFDDSVPHSFEEYEDALGPGYLREVYSRYHPTLGGRSLDTFGALLDPKPVETLLADAGPCRHLDNTSHFHMDLYGHYVPARCPGLAVALDDLGTPLERERYPILTTLYTQGLGALFDMASQRGFTPAHREDHHYCQLCEEIRAWLGKTFPEDYPEIRPLEFYTTDRQ